LAARVGQSSVVYSSRVADLTALMSTSPPKKIEPGQRKVTLKTIASQLSLTPGTVSAALNDSPAARSIPEHTKKRILEAAKELNYRPNYFARALRLQRTYTIGVIAEEIGDAYGALVISGIEEYLRKHNFFFLTVIHRHDQKLLHTYAQMLLARGVEGFITTDTTIKEKLNLPTVAVANHERVEGVTNIVLDHQLAAKLALSHLASLGHKDIAFLKGSVLSADAADRWKAICEVALEMGIQIHPELVVQIDSTDSTPRLGYPFAKQLLERRKPFTALLAYNDISAIGAIWAFQEAGLVVPRDISVVGFDDIPSAAFNTPSLTTVRQPLLRMGNIAAKTVIDQIEGNAEYLAKIAIEPEFVVRASTGRAPVVPAMPDMSGESAAVMEREGEIASTD
jgi:DNA-binding LacI/PurR family transcriptional regulator